MPELAFVGAFSCNKRDAKLCEALRARLRYRALSIFQKSDKGKSKTLNLTFLTIFTGLATQEQYLC